MLRRGLFASCVVVGVMASWCIAAEPVRMGCGIMTFDTVPGWGLDAEGL